MLLLAFTACGGLSHITPESRNDVERHATAVSIESYCGNVMSTTHVGQGVAISERHVLTAQHLVACAAIPRVYARVNGFRHKMAVTQEDDVADIAKLELLHAGRFGLNIAPPELGGMPSWAEVYQFGPPTGCVSRQGEYEICSQLLPPDVLGTALEHGDSGSGVYDTRGRLIGLVRSRLDWADPATNELRTATRITIVGATWLNGT